MRFGEIVDLRIAPAMTIENGNTWFFAIAANGTAIIEEAIIQNTTGAIWQCSRICPLFVKPLSSTIKIGVNTH